jgi:hypothetical protein
MGALCSRLDTTLNEPRGYVGTGLIWRKVAGDIQQEHVYSIDKPFAVGCLLYHTQLTFIPADLTRIAFSMSAASGVMNITEMRLISDSQSDICLGYVAQSRANEVHIQVATLRGFVLAVGSRGVHALRVINGGGHASEWIGNPEDVPVTNRLWWLERLTALEVGVDVSLSCCSVF